MRRRETDKRKGEKHKRKREKKEKRKKQKEKQRKRGEEKKRKRDKWKKRKKCDGSRTVQPAVAIHLKLLQMPCLNWPRQQPLQYRKAGFGRDFSAFTRW